MTIAGPWPMAIELPFGELAVASQRLIGHRYTLSTLDVLGDTVCLLPDDDGALMSLRLRLLDLAAYPDDLDAKWQLHLTVCRGANTQRVSEVRRALAAALPLTCTVRNFLLAEMLSPSDVRLGKLASQLDASSAEEGYPRG